LRAKVVSVDTLRRSTLSINASASKLNSTAVLGVAFRVSSNDRNGTTQIASPFSALASEAMPWALAEIEGTVESIWLDAYPVAQSFSSPDESTDDASVGTATAN
jgi:hypothetical protein